MPKVNGYQDDVRSLGHVVSNDMTETDAQFSVKEPGFSLTVDSLGKLSASDKGKIFGQIGALLSVAIFEQRDQAIEVRGPTHD